MSKALLAIFLCLSIASAQVLLGSIEAPGDNISGLAYGNGSLWAIDCVSNCMYVVDPVTGDIRFSWQVEPASGLSLTGCGFGNNTVYVSMDYSWVFMYSVTGMYLGYFSAAC